MRAALYCAALWIFSLFSSELIPNIPAVWKLSLIIIAQTWIIISNSDEIFNFVRRIWRTKFDAIEWRYDKWPHWGYMMLNGFPEESPYPMRASSFTELGIHRIRKRIKKFDGYLSSPATGKHYPLQFLKPPSSEPISSENYGVIEPGQEFIVRAMFPNEDGKIGISSTRLLEEFSGCELVFNYDGKTSVRKFSKADIIGQLENAKSMFQ